MKKIKYYILAIFSVLTLCLVPVGRVSAVSDVNVTITQSSSATYLCGGDSSTPCTDYKYIKFVVSNFSNWGLSAQKTLTIRRNNTNYNISVHPHLSPIFDLQYSDITAISVPVGGSNLDSTWSMDVTLSANPFSDCPEPEPCPECEDCNEPFIVQLFREGFWGVATAIVTIIVPIIALFIVFRLVHDLLWGRG